MRNALRAAMAVPTTLAGSIALSLSALPADAAVSDRAAQPRDGLSLPVHAMPLPAAVRASVRPAATAPATYTVRRGDTVSAIAHRYGLTTTSVLARNRLTWHSVIYPGQVLRLTARTASADPPAGSATAARSYTVVRGDTLTRIARVFGVDRAVLLRANRLTLTSIIYPGQRLTIPGRKTPAAAPHTPVKAPSPAPAAGSWKVQPGDTVTAIAGRFGVSVSSVLTANGLTPTSIIYPGQRLVIPSPTGLTVEQSANARLIIRIGRQLGVPDRGIAIALGTAMQESSLRNLAYGDRDSLGLFQQRPSYGWGTPAQIRDASRSIRVFYGGPQDPNGAATRGLLDIPGWQSMTFAKAAQAVQNSAYPAAYGQWEAPARRWLAALE